MKILKAKKKNLREISEIFRIESAKKPYFQRWNKRTAIKKINKL